MILRLTTVTAALALSGSLALAQAPLQLQPKPATAAAAIGKSAAPPQVPTIDAGTAVQKANGWFNANGIMSSFMNKVRVEQKHALLI